MSRRNGGDSVNNESARKDLSALVKIAETLFLHTRQGFPRFLLVPKNLRLSYIPLSEHKSYLTYPYPTRGIDKKRITTRVVNTLVV